MASLLLALSLLGTAARADSLASIDHVVLFMQENRAFDHYFGTMAGVRGFSDPNVQVNNGVPVFKQDVDASLSNATTTLLPWYLNYLGGQWVDATQCMVAGDNGWTDNHAALNSDLNNKWALNNTPWSWGHFRRSDIPVHFAIAEGWTVADMYQQGVIASTNPNRVTWISGSINCPGSPQSPSQGGVTIDNNEVPGCEGPHLNCYPLKWKTVPEYYQDKGVTWQVYQDVDNFDDNPLAWFKQFQTALPNSQLYQRGLTYKGLSAFYADCAAGTLPQVSYIVGPAELSEHPPYQPKDGAWLQRQVVEAFTKSKSYKNSVLMISYDETGGFGDHVTPFHSPPNTPGEWMADPYHNFGNVYTGPGFRLPFYIVSPWTRGGNVYVEHADHNSQIMFIEQWIQAKTGKNVTTTQMPSWRRANMADLTKAFNFADPDYSLPRVPTVPSPSTNSAGVYDGYATCEAAYPTQRPPVPYAQQTGSNVLGSESGFKTVRGQMTEGRYLTLEMHGFALNGSKSNLTTSKATSTHHAKSQRFVLHQLGTTGNSFQISSATSGNYIDGNFNLVPGTAGAVTFAINDLGNGRGYSLQDSSTRKYLAISNTGGRVRWVKTAAGFGAYSVT